jgi:hypothetical protein
LAVYPLLAVLWALVLVPPMVRRRVRHRAELAEFDRIRLCFVGSKSAPSHDRAVASHDRDASQPAPARCSATQRRRRVLGVIGVTMAATLVVAVVVGTRTAWGMHLLSYDVLIAYVGLLARSRDHQARRSAVVHPAVRPAPVPAIPPEAAWPEPEPEPAWPGPPRPIRLPRPSRVDAPAPLPGLLHAASR